MVLCVVMFQVPLFIPALFSFTCLFMVALSLYSDPVNTGIGFAITLTGVPAYYLFIVWDKKPKWFRKLLGKSPWDFSPSCKLWGFLRAPHVVKSFQSILSAALSWG